MTELLVRDVRPVALDRTSTDQAPGTEPVDILIQDGVVAAIAPDLPAAGVPELAGAGRWVVPGLWDQHVHMIQWALVRSRLDLSGTGGVDEAVERVRRALAASATGEASAAGSGIAAPLIGWGHRTAGWARQPTVADLDAVSPGRPIVLISGDGHHGWLNSAALHLLACPPREGVVAENEWFDAYDRLGDLPGAADLAEAAVLEAITAARAQGVVGIVDLEFSPAWDLWPGRLAARGPFRVRTGAYASRLEEIIERGWRTGTPLPGTDGWAQMGPLKVISDGSLNTRTAWCCDPYADSADLADVHGLPNFTQEELTRLVDRAREHGLETALHAIGDRAVRQALEVFRVTGATGSIEHAQLVNPADLPHWSGLPVRASIQPAHLIDDRDATERLWPDRTRHAFAYRPLLEAGIPLALGSDAPVAPLDPWLAMAAAVWRGSPEGDAWHPELSLTPAEALAASVDGRRLTVGQPGDLVLLDTDPYAEGGLPGAPPDGERAGEQARVLREMSVAATVIGGHLVHGNVVA
ncbi:amidohydrolase family protein [Ornithinimicrobium ciconiae]|uniref:Amidohydrolase family protein n=1 Tax=Ornithinimicrobium ciconiae TaxID=2594265 RepID=A0A516GDQ2_9MICO|nr:amidohydrolase family protein [Ornithinimicrobium ciconiae]QDO89653.1 amidohydrolase family protein [Ornithinimicrobium ciconiae]